ncbi:hypothetical protein D9756_004611 [Leucocoprinus leucothites]|uniref:NACHT domain-containing protein n=1 Tax=Leucocoprinus leucothites TaxID=201217 RepID=A0A8H5LKJ5_9AGAR|nr:hypothetical protein D9756_004611 [Leucoagaricus leucothites]
MSKSNDEWPRGRGGPRGAGRPRGRGQARYYPSGQTHRGAGRGRQTGLPGSDSTTTISSSQQIGAPIGKKDPAMSSRRQMELMPSVSRSSGLDKDGDSLKKFKVQEEYRTFIEEKVEKVLKRHENLDSETEDARKNRIEEQENILILFRKLREGVSSSGRVDSFSIEVYERSLYLSILFSSPKHTTAIVPPLLGDLYPKASSASTDPKPNLPSFTYRRHMSLLISLTHHLITQYPSQSLYHQQQTSVPKDWLPQITHNWLRSLTYNLRSGNYYQLSILTSEKHVGQVLELHTHGDTSKADVTTELHNELAIRALRTVVDVLRSKARDSTWKIMKAAYREIWFEEPYDTRRWLCFSLGFDNSGSGEEFGPWLGKVEELVHGSLTKTDSIYKCYNISKATITANKVFYDPINATETAALDSLNKHTVPGGEYDSLERNHPPFCHPGTRLGIRSDVKTWLHNQNREEKILWLHGPAGAGKSAIMQSLAEDESIPGATFFFSRSKRIDHPLRLFTTIAYRLATKFKSYREYIVNVLTHDPNITAKKMSTQFQSFIEKPFVERTVLEGLPDTVLIIVDGLDECKGTEEQREIILLIRRLVFEHPEIPLVWVISSRPEPHIRHTFSHSTTHSRYREINVRVNSNHARTDVERFLRDKFQETYERYRDFFPLTCTRWPSEEDFFEVAKAASGHFGFGSVVMSFIIDEDYGNPVSQLEIVLNVIRKAPLSNQKPNPLAILDNLYAEILSTIHTDVLPTTTRLLRISFDRRWIIAPAGRLLDICGLLRLRQEDVYGALRKLHSVVEIPPPEEVTYGTQLKAFHNSFSDYITSPHRSANFHVEDPYKEVLSGAIRVLLESHNPVDSTICPSRVTLSWALNKGEETPARQACFLLVAAFDTVLINLAKAISYEDISDGMENQLAAFFGDVLWANLSPSITHPLYSLGMHLYCTKPVGNYRLKETTVPLTPPDNQSSLKILEDWGLARKIDIQSINLDYVRSKEAARALSFLDPSQYGLSAPGFFKVLPSLKLSPCFLNPAPRDKTPLCEEPRWKRYVQAHLEEIASLPIPARVYLVGKEGRSILAILPADSTGGRREWCMHSRELEVPDPRLFQSTNFTKITVHSANYSRLALPGYAVTTMFGATIFQGKGFFKKARRIFFWKPTLVDNSIQQTFYGAVETIDSRYFDLLAGHVIPGVEHDSSERVPPPRCHPGTRVEICERINHSWFCNPERQHKVLWLHGHAGVGKSAIMQTLAEAESDCPVPVLGATVFFSRRSGRNDTQRLFTSIAYQLAVKNQGYRTYVGEILARDPKIVEKSMNEQFKWFIVKPFVERDILQGLHRTLLLMIDGLDECQGEEAQRELIILIGQFALEHPQTSPLWAIASRPEPHILAAFNLPHIRPSYWEIDVPVNSNQTCADIERFLDDKFREIRQRYSAFFPSSTLKWPSEGDFLKIARAAAGLFIFASTVIRFIIDESYGNPISQLKRVLDLIDKTPSSELHSNPFATLDGLYTEILSAIPVDVLPTTKRLLALSFGTNSSRDLSGIPYANVPIFWISCNMLKLNQADAHGALRKLHSLVLGPLSEGDPDRTFLEAFHASFVDYIMTPSRSGAFGITEPFKLLLAAAIRVLIESHNALDSTIELSRVEVSWAYEEEDVVQRKLLSFSFETVFSEIRQAISCEDDPRLTGDKLAAFFQDLDYGKPDLGCGLLSGDLFVYAEPSIFSVLMDWGLARAIPLDTVVSFDLNRVRSGEVCQVGISDDSGSTDRRSIPSFFYQKHVEELIRGKNPLSHDPNWRRRISVHLRGIMALRLRCPPRNPLVNGGT